MGACESYWDRQIEKMKKYGGWSKRKLSFQGRVHVIKSEIINSIMYAIRSKILPEKYKTELKKMIWGFLWNNKADKVKRNACTRMTHYGGLVMPDIEKVIQTRESKCLGE